MRFALAQIDPVVGAFEGNVNKIQETYARACQAGARVLVTPELGVCGYPPHDLVERPEMFDRNERALAQLMAATQGKDCALIVGHIARNPSSVGRAAQNVVSVLEKGALVFRQAKTLLPTYDVFDEARYFEPAEELKLWNCDGVPVAIAICEDLWGNDPAFGRKLYGHDPVEKLEKLGPKLLISVSASPYEFQKRARREALHGEIARRLKVPLVYVNQVGATDETLFDGGSFVLDSQGGLKGRLPIFKTSFGVLETDDQSWLEPSAEDREDTAPVPLEGMRRGLVLGIRDYFAKTGFTTAILGLSGGIDSAIVATLAAQALGPGNVLGVAMPSQYSSSHSLQDAEKLAANLGIRFEVRPIKFLFASALRELSEGRGALADIAQENLQARLRGVILMTFANHYKSLVLTTGNKSELAVGYCTQYGDMVGALAPIADLFKTQVYELARYLNQSAPAGSPPPIPDSTLNKPPSAELKPGQVDQDSLPPYDELDPVLADYIEKSVPVAELLVRYPKSAPWLKKILRLLELTEYKRRQAAPVLRISHKAFGIGRRIPIAKTWEQTPGI